MTPVKASSPNCWVSLSMLVLSYPPECCRRPFPQPVAKKLNAPKAVGGLADRERRFRGA